MRAQPAASHWIAGAPFEDAAGDAARRALPRDRRADRAACTRRRPPSLARALEAARDGFAAWSATPPAQRARVLRRAADLIRARNRELAELETLDTGKPISETLVADWASGADALEWFAGLAASLSGEAIDLGGDLVYTRREPLGVCLGIGAWNYPSQIACWKAAPALACGNALIFKPSELTPLGALKLGEILAEAGLPAGAFTVVQGGGAVGAALAADPGIAKISLTGSVPTGGKVYAAAAAGPEAGDARARRQVAAARLRRRRPRRRRRRRHARQLLLRRPGLLERHPRLRRALGRGRLPRPAGRPHRAHRPRRPDGRGRADGPADLRGAGREGDGLHRQRPRRGRPPPHRRRTGPRRRASRAASSCSRRSSPTSPTR